MGWLACLGPGLAAAPVETEVADVFVAGTEGYHTFRIPSVIRSANGDLLAFCEGRKDSGRDAGDIDLLLRRSTDGGQTWGAMQVLWDDAANTCGNPCPVLDARTGTLWLLVTHNVGTDEAARRLGTTLRASRSVWVMSSTDHGASWTSPREITADTKRPDWTWYATGPGIGIQLREGPHAGRLVVPCDHDYRRPGEPDARGAHVIYSDDGGATWRIGGGLQPDMNECQVAELHDGRGTLLIDMRSYRRRAQRAQAVSRDGGETWSQIRDVPALVDPVCQASLLRLEGAGGGLLFSNPAHPKNRVKLTVRASADDGGTWDRSLTLHAGPSAYSCLVQIDAHTAGCLFECGEKRAYERIRFERFPLAALTAP